MSRRRLIMFLIPTGANMSGTELTAPQQIRFGLLSAVNFDTAAAAEAIKFVEDDQLFGRLGNVWGYSGLACCTGFCFNAHLRRIGTKHMEKAGKNKNKKRVQEVSACIRLRHSHDAR